MLLILLVLSVILFAISNVFASNKWQIGLSFVFGFIFIASLTLVTLNVTHHFGIKQEVITKKVELQSSVAQSQIPILLYQGLGDGTEKVYLYRTDEQQKKPKATNTDKVKNVVKPIDGTKAYLTNKKKQWVYKNSFYRFLFNIADNNHEYIKQTNEFYLPASWVTLSVKQAKSLEEQVKKNQAKMAKEVQAYVMKKMKEAILTNPQMDEVAQKQLSEKFQKEYQSKAIAEIIQKVKNEK